jgi:type II secretory pathway component PulJ
MKILRNGRLRRLWPAGFTVVELLLAASIFALMLIFLLSLSDSVRKGWERGEHSVEVSQNGRAILNLLERDLSQAVVSRTMQFAQNPNITSLLPSGEAQVANSTSLFFWTRSRNDTAESGLAQVGWYVAQKPAATDPSQRFLLCRFHRDLSATNAQLNTGTLDLTRNISWLTSPAMNQATFSTNSAVVFSGALGFWAVCLDRNGNPIPNLAAADPDAAPLRFNSGARFLMSSRGTTLQGTNTTVYTDVAAKTLEANALPASIRIVLLLTDERTLKRHPSIDPIPADTLPAEMEAIARYSEDLAKKGVPNRIFSTTIKLMNSYDN